MNIPNRPMLRGDVLLIQPTAEEIKTTARRFRDLFGTTPRITISGVFRNQTIQSRVTGVGSDSLTLAGNLPDVDPTIGRDVRVTFSQDPGR